jgi:hypothetical protein
MSCVNRKLLNHYVPIPIHVFSVHLEKTKDDMYTLNTQILRAVLKRLLSFPLFISFIVCSGQSRTYLSEQWVKPGSTQAFFTPTKVLTDNQSSVYSVGSNINASNTHDIYIQKHDRNGNLVWDYTFDGAAGLDDFAGDICFDQNFNLYVTGASIQNTSDGLDLVVFKINPSGQLLWQQYYSLPSGNSNIDAGTTITSDGSNSVFIGGSSATDNSMSDFVTLKISASTGLIQWSQRYDYSSFNDVPSKIEIRGNIVFVSGASQTSLVPNKWDLLALSYHEASGSFISERRSTGSATSGTDKIYDLALDDANNIYLIGSVTNLNTEKDIIVYKLNEDLDLVWERTIDYDSNNDVGKAIRIDSQGNIIITGYVSSDGSKDMYVAKMDSFSNIIWSHIFKGNSIGDDSGECLTIDANDDVFVSGNIINESRDVVIYKISASGDLKNRVVFDSDNELDDASQAIGIDIDGNLVVAGNLELTQGVFRNMAIKYLITERSGIWETIPGQPVNRENELIIRFEPEALNLSVIDNTNFPAGQLSNFVKPNAISTLNQKLGFDFGKCKTFKVHPRMTSADTISLSRLGNSIRLDNHWASLVVETPKGKNFQAIQDSLETMETVIEYFSRNGRVGINSVPDDPQYSSNQSGLYNNQHGINVELAWSATDNQIVGEDYTRIGVIDTGIFYLPKSISRYREL